MQATHEDRALAIREALNGVVKKPGRTMPNGAIILAQILIDEGEWGNEYIVLAVNIAGRGGLDPFATWRRCVGVQQLSDGSYGPLDYCVWGNYFGDIETALWDFKQRAEEGS